jgi:MFS family permease
MRCNLVFLGQRMAEPNRGGVGELEPSTRKSSLGLVFVIVFIDLLGFAIVLPLLPRYAQRLNATPGQIGLLFSSFSAMQFIFAPLWGRLSDRIGRRPALLGGLFGSVVFYSLFGVAAMRESLALMYVARIGAGIAGATISTAQAYIADATGMEGRAKGMALIGAAFGVGFTFGPIIGSLSLQGELKPGEIAPLNAFPMFLAAGLSLAAFLVAFVKLPESLRTGSIAERRSWFNAHALREAFKTPSVGALLILFFITTFAFAQFESTLSLLTAKFGMDEKYNFYLFSAMGLTLCFMQGLIVRKLVPRLGEPMMIILGTIFLAVGLWLVSFSAEEKSTRMLLMIMPLLVAGFSFVTPSAQALISRRSDPSRQGEILGLSQSASAMARILGPYCGNKLFGMSIILPYQVAACVIIPAFLMSIFTVSSGKDWVIEPEKVEPAK